MEEQPTEKLSRKALARQMRRSAYLRAKERRANDPKQLAFNEAMKQRQREAYAASKERRKAVAKEQKARRSEHQAQLRTAQNQQLTMMIVKPASRSE